MMHIFDSRVTCVRAQKPNSILIRHSTTNRSKREKLEWVIITNYDKKVDKLTINSVPHILELKLQLTKIKLTPGYQRVLGGPTGRLSVGRPA